MIRQARSYLVGALSGVTLIGIAIGVFVVLVSAQVFHDFPIVPELSGHTEKAAVSSEKALKAGGGTGADATATTAGGTARGQGGNAGAVTGAAKTRKRHHAAAREGATGNAVVAEAGPNPAAAGDETSTGTGTHSSQPSSAGQSDSSSSSSNGSSSSSSSSSSGSGSSGSSSGESATSSPPTTAGTTGSVSGAADETVEELNEDLGGTLGDTGVTQVTETVINGVAGPETVVGKTVEGVGEVVGGLLGGKSE